MEQSKWKFSKKSMDRLNSVHPDLKNFFVELLPLLPYDIAITSGARTAEEQHNIYMETRENVSGVLRSKINPKTGKPMSHRTNCDGYEHKSNHQVKEDGYGYAVDIAVYVGKNLTWKAKYFGMIYGIAWSSGLLKKYGIEWGGIWKNFEDMPHFQKIGASKVPFKK